MRDEIGFIAIGQAAGNIGLLLEEKGYNVLFINTSTEDLDLLKGAKHIYHIPGGEGCAKDRDKAKKHLAEHLDDLISVIRSKIPQKYVFCIFASGGGTGSGISPFLLSILVDTFGAAEDDSKFFSEPEKYFGAITILPSDKEVLQPVTNSYNCCRELLDIDDLGTIFFLDNNSMENKLTINKIFVDDLDTILRIPEEHKSTKGNVDKSEVKKVLFETHGAGIITCQKRENSTSGQLIRAIREKSIYAPISTTGTARYYIFSTTMEIDKNAFFTEFGEPLDTFQTYNEKKNIVLMTGLGYPKERLGAIAKRVLATKEVIENQYDSLYENDLSADLQISRRRKKKPVVSKAEGGDSTAAPATKKPSVRDILAGYKH